MKKLMTMLAAAAMAFGLYADEPLYTQPDSFEGGWTVTGNWSTNGEATVTQDDWSGETRTTDLPYGFDTVGDKYLTIKTPVKVNETDGLVWANADTDKTIGTGIYFDGLVNFTNCEDPVEVTADDGTKLVVYTVESEIENTDATKTNLYVSAGFWNGATWEAKAYDCGSLDNYNLADCDDTGFWRVTIRSLADISNGSDVNPGFLVFVNGKGAAREEGIGFTDLNSTAAAWASKNNLFPSLVQDQMDQTALTSITAVAFAGQGSIDTVVITRNEPADFVKDEFFTLSLGEHVESLTYTVNGGDVQTLDDGSAVLPYALNMKVEVKTVTYEAGEDPKYGRGDWTLGGATITGNTFEPQSANLTGVVNGKDVTARIMVDGVGYPTFKDAIAALKDAEVKTLTLNKDVTVNKDGTKTEAYFDATTDVTIDLNGKTITGADDNTGFVLMTFGKLYVTDTSTDKEGCIVAATGSRGVIGAISTDLSTVASVKIDAGIYNGKVDIDPGEVEVAAASTADLQGGSFASDDDQAFYLADYVADGFEPAYAEGYWTVAEIPGNTLKVIANEKATFVLTVGGDVYTDVTMPEEGIEVKPDVAYELVATAADNYEYDGEKTKTISGDMPDEALTLTVPAPTAVVKTITYTGYPEESQTYSVESYPAALYVPTTEEGYEFKGWLKDDVAFTLEDLKALDPVVDVTLTADIEAITYTITYVGGDGATGEMEPETFTLEDGSITLTANQFEKDGFEFVGWKDQDGTEYADEAEIDPLPARDLTLTAQWKSKGAPLPDPIKEGNDEQKAAYADWARDNEIDNDDPINAVAFALDVSVTLDIEEDVQDALDDVLETEQEAADEVAKFSADYTPDYFDVEAYPNATFIFVETKEIEAENGRFFRLKAEFKPLP